jgi:hypothetical protein
MVQKYEKEGGRKNVLVFLFWSEVNTRRINAIAFPRCCGAIVKNMTLVPTTIRTYDFYAHHSVGGVFVIFNGAFYALFVARPSASAVKLRSTFV